MKSKSPALRMTLGSLLLLLVVAVIFPVKVSADPLDEVARRTFHISTLGNFDLGFAAADSAQNYRTRMLTLNGGVMPKNLKVGYSTGINFMQSTYGNYYDYLYSPYFNNYEMDRYLTIAATNDMTFGVHLNGMPWADDANQSVDNLQNFLEKLGGGSLLQVDRLGRIRNSAVAQNPTNTENFNAFSPQLEMQLTLSRNATNLQQYASRNARVAMRMLNWYREEHPDLLTFASMSSEYGQNVHANVEYCDYSSWSKQEFRDWLSGTNLYAGQAQYATLAAFNSAFSGASGFPWASWSAVQPPTTVSWSTTSAAGRWWRKWHDFRIVQVAKMEQEQFNWCGDAGWSPDLLYGHQICDDPNTTDNTKRKQATPWTTTFADNGANGVTTYGTNANSTNLFAALRANDKNWGIFEFNPLASNSVTTNLNALNAVWNYQGRVVCPNLWYGQPAYQIISNSFETALTQFIYNHRNDAFTNLAAYEVSPVFKDVVWAMSEIDDIETSSQISGLWFANGILSGNITGPDSSLSLELNDAAHYLISDAYCAVSFRLCLSNSVPGLGQVSWINEFGSTKLVNFVALPGWNVYRINLAEKPGWREQRIQKIELQPASANGGFALDWFRLEANHCWHFNVTNEIYGANQLTNLVVTNGVLTAVSGADGYFYLATDKSDPNVDADRAWINADVSKKVRVRLTSSAAATAQLYWWKRGTSFFSTTFAVNAGTQTYEVDLSADPNWTGKVTRFRLDPVNAAGLTISVEYVSVSPVMLAPRLANTDLIVNSSTPVFVWEKAIEPNHTNVVTDVQLATDFGFTNVICSTNGLGGSQLTYNGTTVLDGLYWWRARTRDGAGAVSAWATPMPMFVRVWNFNSLSDVTSSNNFGAATITGGVWQATTTGVDPYVYFNSGIGISRGINADLYKQFHCKARVSTAGANSGQFFFFPRAGGFGIATVSLPADNAWHDLVFDLSTIPEWRGYIDSVRFDPAGASGLQVSLDTAEMLPAAATAAAPANWQFNTNGNAEGWSLIDSTAALSVTNGLLTLDVAALNAVAQITPIALDSRQFGLFKMSMRNGTAGTGAKLYWITDADPLFAEARSVIFPVNANDTNFTTYSVDLSANAAWTNSLVTGLRLLPATNAVTGRLEVDWITITGPGGMLRSSAVAASSPGAHIISTTAPEIKSCSMSSDHSTFHLVFQGASHQSYRLQASTNLTDWFDLSTNSASASGIVQYDDASVSASGSKFYRFITP